MDLSFNINDLGLWVVLWLLVDSPVCMTLLERWGNAQMDDNALWCVEGEGLAVRVMSGNGAHLAGHQLESLQIKKQR
jgi:hypothetical protein